MEYFLKTSGEWRRVGYPTREYCLPVTKTISDEEVKKELKESIKLDRNIFISPENMQMLVNSEKGILSISELGLIKDSDGNYLADAGEFGKYSLDLENLTIKY